MTPTGMDLQSLKSVASLCHNIPCGKILSGAAYGAAANIYRPANIADMELSSPQCLLLALLKSSVAGDVTACLLLGEICNKVEKLRLRHYRLWLLEEFAFPRPDIEKAMAFLTELLAEGILKLPPHVMGIMTSLANKYGISGVQLRTLSEEGRSDLAIQLEAAVANNSPRDIFDLVSEGADISRRTASGDSLLHLAAKADFGASITALGILTANLEVLNSSNATPLEEAVRNNCASSVKALLMAGAKFEKRLVGGDTYLHVAAAGVHNAALETLLERKIDVNEKNHLGETPLVQAIKADNIRGVKMLLEKGADFSALSNVRLKEGDSIVHSIARSGNVEVLKILKRLKLTANVKNQIGLTPLHVASSSSIVRVLLRMGLCVDTQDNRGITPLMIAAGSAKADVVSSLLLNHADPQAKDNNGRSPLHHAVEGGCVASVTALLFAGARVDDQDNNGDTPTLLAAVSNKLPILQLLVERADLTLKDRNGDGILHRSARSGHVEVVTALIDAGVVLHMKGQNQKTALHIAAEEGHTAVMEKLLNTTVMVDIKDQYQKTALHYAARHGHTAVVKKLLHYVTTVDMKDTNQRTALHLAAQEGHTGVIRALLDAGAAADMKDQRHSTSLHIAARHGHTAVVTALLHCGTTVDMKDHNHMTALHIATKYGRIEVVRALLGGKAAVDEKDKNQYTALHWAAEKGRTEESRALLDRGAAPGAKAVGGCTPLMLASMNGHLALVQMLIDRGANLNDRAENGWTALCFANTNNRRAVAEYLRYRGGVQ